MKEEIKRLIEDRTAEARKKDITEKAVRILRTIGQEIRHDSLNALDYDYETEYDYDSDIPEAEEGTTAVVGLYYDFLNSGCNMQIVQDFYKSDLTISLHGHLVFQETNGELIRYLPMAEWEEKLNSMFEFAKKRERDIKKEEQETREKDWVKQKKSITDYLWDFWGFRV